MLWRGLGGGRGSSFRVFSTLDARVSSLPTVPKVGLVSLGCPKALVDSERIVTHLRAQGYVFSQGYEEADVVLVNTCGFLDSAKAESLQAIGEAMSENGRVIVTGCMGKDQDTILKAHPGVLAITGPHQYEEVVAAVNEAVPPLHDPRFDLLPPSGLKLTPRHYAYLKISEGCNHRCTFCIIPSLRGDLVSRPLSSILYEAERLVQAGVKELLVISQDTSAYGLDLGYRTSPFRGRDVAARFYDLALELGKMGVWVRLHYVYPYPHVDDVIPLMAQGVLLPYLDIPFQHASPRLLKAMRRPAHQAKTLSRIEAWRDVCPSLALRSTFIVGFPGETEEDFSLLLDWLKEAKIARAGCFKYEAVAGAQANALDGAVPEEVKQERWVRFMEAQREISASWLAQKVGQEVEVLIDEGPCEEHGGLGRTVWDAPEIDGNFFIEGGGGALSAGDRVRCRVSRAGEYDLVGEVVGSGRRGGS